jgi:hypothetical protein
MKSWFDDAASADDAPFAAFEAWLADETTSQREKLAILRGERKDEVLKLLDGRRNRVFRALRNKFNSKKLQTELEALMKEIGE